MYSKEQRQKAIDTFIRFDHSYADTVAELGYPSTAALKLWWKEYEKTGSVGECVIHRESKYSEQQKREAVSYYLEHGKSLSRTMRALGFPKSRSYLVDWIDKLAPGKRKVRNAHCNQKPISMVDKVQAVVELETREEAAEEVAKRLGVTRSAPYIWRRQIIEHNGEKPAERGTPVSKPYDDLPDDIEELSAMIGDLKKQARALQLEIDVLRATADVVKKEVGADPKRLTNAEKAALIDTLRPKWALKDLLPMLGMAKSSYEYARAANARGERTSHAEVRCAVIEAFELSGAVYGYRRVHAAVNAGRGDGKCIGEWTVRAIMRDEHLEARAARRKRRYSSYAGEISDAPANLLRDERGRHHFRAENPNELWITDITEFRIPSGKVYLSPVIDCFDGCPLDWSISTSPDAEMANSSLLGACKWLGEGDHPIVHNDRGCHYRWPGWILICDEHGLVRSMSRKGCSPDNARCEGFFGRLKIEFFYGRDWRDVSIEEFIAMLDSYLLWYREERIKSDLGYQSPLQYRISRGLAA